MSVLEPRVTSNARLRFYIFFNSSYFCMCNFVSGNKGNELYSRKQSCTYKSENAILADIDIEPCIEPQSHNFLLHNGTVKSVGEILFLLISSPPTRWCSVSHSNSEASILTWTVPMVLPCPWYYLFYASPA